MTTDAPSPSELLQAIDDLAGIAGEFCAAVEAARNGDDAGFIDRLDELLPLLYHRAARLNSIAPDDLFDADEELFESEQDFPAAGGDQEPVASDDVDRVADELAAKLAQILGWRNRYYEAVVESDEENDYDVEQHLLSEDLATMYGHLKDQLAVHGALDRASLGPDGDVQDFARDLLTGFMAVWGFRIPHLMMAVFDLMYGELHEGEEEEPV
ncbi:MAG TPA: DUF5063 domain-containing protein [Dehalococcoidia bacterium]|jgi:hypothetical protein